jgi:large subunit ribosomal protein L4e
MPRALVSVAGTKEQVPLPAVLNAPIRLDVVHHVHRDLNKNKRQAYAVASNAGHQHSAESWGTGRAVSRIPRVSGGGTHRAGQAAFGNMCRKGRMFAPTKTHRRWHRKVAVNQRRFAVVSALSASAVPALVFSRGHKVENVEEVPLVVPSEVESLKHTKQAIDLLKKVGAYADVERAKRSLGLRAGSGKARNRRYVHRRGPLVVYAKDNGIVKAFRNLPGVELVNVNKLNLLQLAPGGHLGRFVVWTKDAFTALDSIFGTQTKLSQTKSGYKLPRAAAVNVDLARLINSEEIQSVVRAKKNTVNLVARKVNPLNNLRALKKLNPYAAKMKKVARKDAADRVAKKAELRAAKIKALNKRAKENKASKSKFYKTFLAPIVDKAAGKAKAAEAVEESLY